MLSKQEVLDFLRDPVYKVGVHLLNYPYKLPMGETVRKQISRESLCTHVECFRYVHTQETVSGKIFDKRYVCYYLQIKNGEIYEVSDEIINELGDMYKIEPLPIKVGLDWWGNLYEL